MHLSGHWTRKPPVELPLTELAKDAFSRSSYLFPNQDVPLGHHASFNMPGHHEVEGGYER